jgi:hypothetical protein
MREPKETDGLITWGTNAPERGVNLSSHAKAVCYRLAQYKIIDDEKAGLWWVGYAGLGRLKIGPSFVEGDILFIGHPEKEKAGGRKKFVEHIRRLPKWKKTNYYCCRFTLQICDYDKTVPAEAMSTFRGKCSKKISNSLIADMCRDQIRPGQKNVPDVGFKKYINTIRRWIASIGTHLPF